MTRHRGPTGGGSAGATGSPGAADPHLSTGARAVHALPPAESAGFDAHLAGCPTCAAEYAELQATAARLGGAAGTMVPPTELRAQVLAAAARTPQLPPAGADESAAGGHPVAGGHPAAGGRSVAGSGDGPVDPPGVIPLESRRARRPSWLALPTGRFAAAAAVVLLAGGITWAVVSSNDDPSLTASQQMQQCVSHDLEAADMMPEVGDGGMVQRSDHCSAVLIHLPAMTPPDAQRYQLWMTGDGATRSLGTVPMPATSADNGGSGDDEMLSVPAPMEAGDQAVMVTMEPATGSASPTGDPLWMVPLH